MQSWFNVGIPSKVIHHVNRLKGKNNTIISTDVEKVSKNIQHSFIVKSLNELPQFDKVYLFKKATINIIVNG